MHQYQYNYDRAVEEYLIEARYAGDQFANVDELLADAKRYVQYGYMKGHPGLVSTVKVAKALLKRADLVVKVMV